VSHPASVRARRAGGLAVLTLGAFSLGGPATALAAPGDEAPDPGATTLPEAGPAAELVLTPVPLPVIEDGETATAPTGAHFGWGKLEPDVVLAPGSSLPAGAVLDRTGAEIRVTYTQVWGENTSDVVQFPAGPPVLECTWDASDADDNGNPCDFTGAVDLVSDEGEARLYPMSAFAVELIAAPTSGQVLLPAAGGRAIQGYTDWSPDGPVSAIFETPGAPRDAPAADGSPVDIDEPVALPVAVPTIPEQSAPTTPAGTPTPTPAGATPAATTGTPTAADIDGELASTGAEPLPVLALGSGLVLAGGAVIVAAARRRTR
jgi:hypothetical protein